MYKCDKPDKEEYLLGRRIDKHVDDPKADDEANKGKFSFIFTPFQVFIIVIRTTVHEEFGHKTR